MFLGLGQYQAEDIPSSGGDPWTGSIYDPGMTPSVWVSDWAANVYQPTSAPSSGLLPVLQNVVSGAASIVGKFFDLQSAKAQAEAIQKQTAALRAGIIPTATGVQAAGFGLPANWPIYGIIIGGAYLVMRGRKNGGSIPTGKRRRRKR